MTRRPRGARALIGLALAAVLALVLAAPAAAHPLGNFSVNHVTEVRVDRDGVVARYLLDRAEIPTFQSRGTPAPALLAQVRGEVARGLEFTVDGRRVALRPTAGARIEFQPGQGGLRTTRVTLPLRADVRDPRDVAVRDRTYGDRAGWVAVVPKPGTGTAVDSSVPADDPTDGLRTYPSDALRSPVDERAATLTVAAGDGTVTAPRRDGSGTETEGGQRADDGFADLLADAVSGKTALVLLLLAAFGWGALHALSPGHGKAMVAAYLVGARGTVKHAVALGGVVTFTHTIGVFALGAVTLALSAYVLPEQLYPWLTLVSGVLVLAVGAGVLRSRLRVRRAMAAGDGAVTLHGQEHAHDHGHTHAHSHDHGHSHSHDQGHSHTHDHGHSHTLVHSHGGGKPHSHEIPTDITWKGLVGLGASAGLIPCPSALVVLLGAISQHAVGLGLVLIVAFSLGLAATLVALGIAVVQARRLTTRVRIPRRFATAAPALSAGLIVAVGLVLTIQAMPKVL